MEQEDPFGKLLAQLEYETWPMVYLFKFIVPNEQETIARVTALFESQNELSFHDSSKGNYTSVTVKELMLDANSVIEIYRKAATIKGVITL